MGLINPKILNNKDKLNQIPFKILTFQFKLYDKDGSGSVELAEMIEILTMIYQVGDICQGTAWWQCQHQTTRIQSKTVFFL